MMKTIALAGAALYWLASVGQVTGESTFELRTLDTKLPKAISDHTATRQGTLVYLAGGCDALEGNKWDAGAKSFLCFSTSSSFYVYNIETDTIATLPDMPVARYRHAAVAANNKLWLLGGRTGMDAIIEEIDVYDISTNTWSTVEGLPEAYFTSDHTGFASENRYAYFLGGYDQNYTALDTVFSIDATSADPLSTLTARAPLNVERGDISSAIDPVDGTVLVAGGFTHANDFCEPHEHAELYNVAADTWTDVAPLQFGRADKALVHLEGGSTFFALGGERQVTGFCELETKPEPGERTIPIDQVERYDRSSDSWAQVADLPANRFRFAAVSTGADIYTFGGQVGFADACDCFATSADIIVYTEVSSATRVSVLLGVSMAVWTGGWLLGGL